MRVLQVVTLASPNGEFGGPLRVALEQSKELRRQGHSVVLAAASRGFQATPSNIEGVPSALSPGYFLIPGAGFSGLVSPRLLFHSSRLLARADIVHIHLSRDLVTLPMAAIALGRARPLVAQTHGMVDPSTRALARPLDAMLTRRVLKEAGAVLSLTAREDRDLQQVVRQSPINLLRLPNGVAPQPNGPSPLRTRPLVLFVGRLHPRKRADAFVDMAATAASRGVDADYAIIGPDEGAGDSVRAQVATAGLSRRVELTGPLAQAEVLDRIREASVLVLPSVDEPFPVTVLEAMSVGTPVIITRRNGLAEAVTAHRCGSVVDLGANELVDALQAVLGDPAQAIEMGKNGKAAVSREFSITSVVDRLVVAYQGVIASSLHR